MCVNQAECSSDIVSIGSPAFLSDTAFPIYDFNAVLRPNIIHNPRCPLNCTYYQADGSRSTDHLVLNFEQTTGNLKFAAFQPDETIIALTCRRYFNSGNSLNEVNVAQKVTFHETNEMLLAMTGGGNNQGSESNSPTCNYQRFNNITIALILNYVEKTETITNAGGTTINTYIGDNTIAKSTVWNQTPTSTYQTVTITRRILVNAPWDNAAVCAAGVKSCNRNENKNPNDQI